jgi:hypothetical protein
MTHPSVQPVEMCHRTDLAQWHADQIAKTLRPTSAAVQQPLHQCGRVSAQPYLHLHRYVPVDPRRQPDQRGSQGGLRVGNLLPRSVQRGDDGECFRAGYRTYYKGKWHLSLPNFFIPGTTTAYTPTKARDADPENERPTSIPSGWKSSPRRTPPVRAPGPGASETPSSRPADPDVGPPETLRDTSGQLPTRGNGRRDRKMPSTTPSSEVVTVRSRWGDASRAQRFRDRIMDVSR